MRAIVATGPEELRPLFRDVTAHQLVDRAAALRPGTRRDVLGSTKIALRQLARRVLSFDAEIAEINELLEPLVAETAPELLTCVGVGTDVASALLVAAGDNPQRLKSERTFAHLCGVSPLDASSGKQERHRLNRSGDRQANSALWRIVMTRIVYDPRTKAYIDRRMKEGLSKREAMRCLKRYVAREVYAHLPRERVA
jgi:transposase